MFIIVTLINSIILNIPDEKAPGKGLPLKSGECAGVLAPAAKAWCQGIPQIRSTELGEEDEPRERDNRH